MVNADEKSMKAGRRKIGSQNAKKIHRGSGEKKSKPGFQRKHEGGLHAAFSTSV
jgi:hypothetical protein